MYVAPIKVEAPEDFTRIMMTRMLGNYVHLAAVSSTLFIDLRHRWPYEDCRYWVNTHFPGWTYAYATHHAYTPSEQGWVKVPGDVLPKTA